MERRRDEDRGNRGNLFEGLKDVSQDAILLQLKTLHALRSSLGKAVAGNDFLLALTRLQLAYYGELLQLVTGHFDAVAERLHDLMAPEKPPLPRLRAATVTRQGQASEATVDVDVTNPGPADAKVSFQGWQWRSADGARENALLVGDDRHDIPGRNSRRVSVTFKGIGGPEFAPGTYEGELTVLFDGQPGAILPVKLIVP